MTRRGFVACSLLTGLAVLGCTDTPTFTPRTRVGTVPEDFSRRPVTSAADAAAYVDAYDRALGMKDVRVARVLGFRDVYWVYVREDQTGRPAFTLSVGADGAIELRKFPAMEPEMMWNQKYGHEARPDPTTIEPALDAAEAARRLRRALPAEGTTHPGKAFAYYGYYLFPLCEQGRPVGEAVVNAVRGQVVWERFPSEPQSAWLAPDADGQLCE